MRKSGNYRWLSLPRVLFSSTSLCVENKLPHLLIWAGMSAGKNTFVMLREFTSVYFLMGSWNESEDTTDQGGHRLVRKYYPPLSRTLLVPPPNGENWGQCWILARQVLWPQLCHCVAPSFSSRARPPVHHLHTFALYHLFLTVFPTLCRMEEDDSLFVYSQWQRNTGDYSDICRSHIPPKLQSSSSGSRPTWNMSVWP